MFRHSEGLLGRGHRKGIPSGETVPRKGYYSLSNPHCDVRSSSSLLRVCRAETRGSSSSSSKQTQCSRTLDDESGTTWARTKVGPAWPAWATHLGVRRTCLRLWRTCLRRSRIVVECSAGAEVETFPLGEDAGAILAFERAICVFGHCRALFFACMTCLLTLEPSIFILCKAPRCISTLYKYRDSDNIQVLCLKLSKGQRSAHSRLKAHLDMPCVASLSSL